MRQVSGGMLAHRINHGPRMHATAYAQKPTLMRSTHYKKGVYHSRVKRKDDSQSC